MDICLHFLILWGKKLSWNWAKWIPSATKPQCFNDWEEKGSLSQQASQWKNWLSAVFRQRADGLFPGLRLCSCAWLTAAGRVWFGFKLAWNSSTKTCVALVALQCSDCLQARDRRPSFNPVPVSNDTTYSVVFHSEDGLKLFEKCKLKKYFNFKWNLGLTLKN